MHLEGKKFVVYIMCTFIREHNVGTFLNLHTINPPQLKGPCIDIYLRHARNLLNV